MPLKKSTSQKAFKENIKTEVKGSQLIITVDLKAKGRDSKSGKTLVIATTGGFAQSGAAGVRFGLNVIRAKA